VGLNAYNITPVCSIFSAPPCKMTHVDEQLGKTKNVRKHNVKYVKKLFNMCIILKYGCRHCKW